MEVLQQVKRLKCNFKNDDQFFAMLTEEIIAENMALERLQDAVTNLLHNCPYREIRAADVLNFDSKIKFYSADEIYKQRGCFPHADFCRVDVNGVIRLALLDEATAAKLTIVKKYTEYR